MQWAVLSRAAQDREPDLDPLTAAGLASAVINAGSIRGVLQPPEQLAKRRAALRQSALNAAWDMTDACRLDRLLGTAVQYLPGETALAVRSALWMVDQLIEGKHCGTT